MRFDAVYYGHFKCNIRRVVDYPNLWGYLRDLYQVSGVAETVNMGHIKEHYYRSHRMINPTGIVPVGPELDLEAPLAQPLADLGQFDVHDRLEILLGQLLEDHHLVETARRDRFLIRGRTYFETLFDHLQPSGLLAMFLARFEGRPIAGALGAYLLLWTFLVGGILDRFARQRPTRAHGFFAASGAFFWRFLRLALASGLVYWFLFSYVHEWLLDDLYTRATRDLDVERTALLWRFALYVVFGALLVGTNLLFDYAKIRAVVEDRIAKGVPVYGSTTGVGAMKDIEWSPEEFDTFNMGLVRAHHFGTGAPFPSSVVRNAMAIRVNTALTGRVGCSTDLVYAYLALLDRDVVPIRVELDPAHDDRAARAAVELATSQQRADAADQLGHREGLRHVVVGAQFEAEHAIDLAVASRQHDDRYVALATQRTADVDARDPGQHDVEDDDVEELGPRQVERRRPVPHGLHVEPLPLERIGDRIDDVGLIVYQQHAWTHRHSLPSSVDSSSIDTVVPLPSWLSIVSVPSITRTASRAIESPRPNPPPSGPCAR